ncbi:MAG: DUF3021 domain-containing protein [Clostridia bacterium]|nr:DUF3021 domain-containing protein [Clostridia bacterium]
MNQYVKSFLHRGLIFGGFGPIVVAIVFMCISFGNDDFCLNALQILLATVSSYLLAFVQAGVTVFNQIEHWSTVKSLLCHFSTLYAAYSVCYVVNSWIPFEPMVLVIFTAVFAVLFFAIWAIVYFSVKATSKKLNSQLKG